ncbi:MAG TPA: sulfatase [Candidatus Omnitrophota bacterium]|mgnify:CR=1 FL=1|nr:sulfatase [Candidatus Omnitrophota bacterium]
MKKRVSEILSLLGGVIICIGIHLPYPFLPQKPNVILIVLDSARADHFSCYGYAKNTTPNMDAIGRDGIIFQNHFSQGVDTVRSTKCYLSSRYVSKNIIQYDAYRWDTKAENSETVFRARDPGQLLLPDLFRSNGYRTASFSDHVFFSPKTPLVSRFEENYMFPVENISSPGTANDNNQKTEKTFSEMLNWIKKHRKEKFFVYAHIILPHAPYRYGISLPEYLESTDKDLESKVRKKFDQKSNDSTADWDSQELRCLEKLYDGNLNYADRLVGNLYAGLKQLHLIDNTVIVITSDHGEDLGMHGKLEHGHAPWDSLIHIPLILHYPPLEKAGTNVTGMTESVDLMPTLADICGLTLPSGISMDGVSLQKYIDEPSEGKEIILAQRSIRTPAYKYLYGADQLFDLSRDPGETRNIAAEKPLIRDALRTASEKLRGPYQARYLQCVNRFPPKTPFHFLIGDFQIEPKSLVYRYYGKSGEENLPPDGETGGRPFLLNLNTNTSELTVLPKPGSAKPLTLTTKIPDGTYQIRLLIETERKIETIPPATIGIQYRFDPKKPFSIPSSAVLKKQINAQRLYYYLALGEIAVKDQNFFLQLLFRSGQNVRNHRVVHVKFIPVSPSAKPAEESPAPEGSAGNNAFREKTNALKALGYL